MSFTIFPAIDLRNGRVVRLKYGDPNQQTTFSDDPVAIGEKWLAAGSDWLHRRYLDDRRRHRRFDGHTPTSQTGTRGRLLGGDCIHADRTAGAGPASQRLLRWRPHAADPGGPSLLAD